MDRRRLLALAAAGIAGGAAGCLGEGADGTNGPDGSNEASPTDDELDVSFELVDDDLEDPDEQLTSDDPPEIERTDDTVRVSGALLTGPGGCTTAKLAYAGYQAAPNALTILVVAADDPDRFTGSVSDDCVPTIDRASYEVEVSGAGGADYVIATEHDGEGEVRSTTKP